MQYSCVNDTSEDMTAIKKRFHRGQKNCTREKIGKKERRKSKFNRNRYCAYIYYLLLEN